MSVINDQCDGTPVPNNDPDIENLIAPIRIEKLQTVGIPAADIPKLREKGICTVDALVRAPKRELLMIKGLTEAKIENMLKEGSKLVQTGFQAASSILAQQKDTIQLTTGSKQLDEILEGGIETGSITEIYGEYRCGKTQLCHTLAVTCQLPVQKGGGEGKCLYIDTEGSFRAQRLSEIATRFGLKHGDCLDNIACARAYNTEHQTQLLATAASMMAESRFSLVVVDSATALYRSEYNGRAELAPRQSHLGRFLNALRKLASDYGVAVLITNQVTAGNLDGSTFTGPSVKPIGGNIMAHATTTRLSMSKGKKEIRKVKIVASPSLAERDTEVSIGPGGIQDPCL